MFLRKLCFSLTLTALALSVAVLSAPSPMQASQVPLLDQEAGNGQDAGISATSEQLAAAPTGSSPSHQPILAQTTLAQTPLSQTALAQTPGLTQTPGSLGNRYLIAAALHSRWPEPAFGRIFASMSTVGLTADLQQALARNTVDLSSAIGPNASPATTGLRKPVSLTSGSGRIDPAVHRTMDDSVALALLFSGNVTITDRQLAIMIAAQKGGVTGPVFAGDCNGIESCGAATAPIPSAVWLIASALLGLIGIGYRRRGPQAQATAAA